MNGDRAWSLAAIAARESVTDRYVDRLIRLAFLAPEIVDAVAVRAEPVELRLTRHVDLPLDWTARRSGRSASNELVEQT